MAIELRGTRHSHHEPALLCCVICTLVGGLGPARQKDQFYGYIKTYRRPPKSRIFAA